MGKKKPHDTTPPIAPEAMPPATPDVATDDHAQPLEQLGALAGEVQSFLTQRDELAQKLAQEIEATERKLAELKRTAALLFPEKETAAVPNKDRKPKKATPGKSPKSRDEAPAKPEPSATASDEPSAATTADSAADAESQLTGAPHEPHLD